MGDTIDLNHDNYDPKFSGSYAIVYSASDIESLSAIFREMDRDFDVLPEILGIIDESSCHFK